MISDINYTDTITAYIDYKESTTSLSMRGWWKDIQKDKHKNPLESWCYHANNVFLRYFPYFYGRSLLYIAFSLPKVYYSTNNNCSHVTNFDSLILDLQLDVILANHVDITQLPSSILDWQVSRLDLFYTHEVPEKDKDDYLHAYKLLYLPRHKNNQYKNTSYLMSNFKKYKSSSVVVRIYDKDVEMYEKGILTEANTLFYPTGVHEDVEKAIVIQDDGDLSCVVDGVYYSRIRIELQLRRRKLLNALKSKSVTIRDVFNESFQTSMINNYFITLGLNRKILSSCNFRKHIDTNGFRTKKRANIITCARLIRKGKSPYITGTSLSKDIVSRPTSNSYVKQLNTEGIHIVTTSTIDLIPIKLL
jgi:hypothetical protein